MEKNIFWKDSVISTDERSRILGHKSLCIWLTGLSGSGKTTIAHELEKLFHEKKILSYILDGDNIRHGLNKDLTFEEADRKENIRRVAEVSKIMVDAGFITIVSFISPFEDDRMLARALFKKKQFVEVFIDTTLDECEKRDPKGLYIQARLGKIKNFTGIDSKYEVPKNPDLHIQTKITTAKESAHQIFTAIKNIVL